MKRSNSLQNLLHWGTRKLLSTFILKMKAKHIRGSTITFRCNSIYIVNVYEKPKIFGL